MTRSIAWLVISLLGLLSACGGRDELPEVQEQDRRHPLAVGLDATTVVSRMDKVGETRVGRTLFEYVFQVTFQNTGVSRSNVTATLIAAGQGTTIVDGSVVIPSVGKGSQVTPVDTVTLRHDRMFPFSEAALVWTFTDPINGVAVPPAPDPIANDSSIAGTDTNGNGIRDDVELLIAERFGSDERRYHQAKTVSATLQSALLSPNPQTIKAHTDSFRCLQSSELIQLFPIEELTLNTVARRKAYGNAFSGTYTSFEGC